MKWIIDIIVLLIIGLSTFIGYKRGLIKSAIKILAFFIAIIVALVLYKPISNLIINKTQIDDNIQNSIINKILPEGATVDEEVEVDQSLTKFIENNAKSTVNNISRNIAVKIIEVSALLIIYIVARIILKFVSILASIIDKIPIIKQFNKAGGTIYGLVKGILVIWIIFAVIYLLNPLMQANFINDVNNSILGGLFYKNNLLLNIIV